MKKIICGFLCLLLLISLFAGCAAQTAEPPVTDAASPQEGAAEPAAPLSFSLESLPEIGAFAPNEKKDYFFPDGPHDVFEPRDDYGEVVPYCLKSEKCFAVPWSYTNEETGEVYSGTTEKGEERYYAVYGFATADGKIITEGIYTYVYWNDNTRGSGFFVAGREQNPQTQVTVDLIAADGSWRIRLDNEMNVDTLNFRSLSEPPLFMVFDEKEAVLYNFQGEKVLDVTQIRDENMFEPEVCYIDSEKLLVKSEDWERDERTYTLFDYNFNKLGQLPPSVDCIDEVYPGGVLLVTLADKHVQLIDVYGNALSEPCFNLQYSEKDHCFFARPVAGKNRIVLLDESGTEKKTLDLSYSHVRYEDGYVWLFKESTHTFYDLNGKETVMDTDGQEIVKVYDLMSSRSDGTETHYCYAETANGDLYVFDIDGNRITTLQDMPFERDEDSEGRSEKYYQFELEQGILYYQKKETLEVMQLASGKTQTFPIKDRERYGWAMILNSRLIAIHYNANDGTYRNSYDIYDIETGKRLFTDAVYAEAFGQYVLVATKTESVLLDETATPLIRLWNNTLV